MVRIPIIYLFISTVCKARLDLGFIVDGSGSVGRANFIRCLNFIKNLVSSFVISPGHSRVGLLIYSHRVIPVFSFGQRPRLRGVLRAISRIRYPGGGTKTGKALSYSRRYLFARSSLRKILILMTDGKSYDRVKKPAAVLRNMGVQVFALGVGKRYSMKQLLQIASNRRHVFTADFRNLGSFVRAIKQKACRGEVRYNKMCYLNTLSIYLHMGIAASKTTFICGLPGSRILRGAPCSNKEAKTLQQQSCQQ